MIGMAKRASAPLVIAKQSDGSFVHLYEGALLPDNLAEGEADRLAEFFEDNDKSDDKPAAKKSAAKSDDK